MTEAEVRAKLSEEGGRATSQGCGASRSGKRQEHSPWRLQRDQPCPHPDSSPVRPGEDSWPPEQ